MPPADVNEMRAVPERLPVGDHDRHNAISGPSAPNTGSVCGSGTRGIEVERGCVFRPAAAAEIVGADRRIGADHDEVRRVAQALVAGAGRQHNDIAGREIDLAPMLAAEADPGATARDAHRLVNYRMIVDVRINAVAPHPAPAVRGEGLFDDRLRVGRAGEIDARAVHHQRQHRIVRDRSVVGEFMGDRHGTRAWGRHAVFVSRGG